jgi:ATP/ADP translocase
VDPTKEAKRKKQKTSMSMGKVLRCTALCLSCLYHLQISSAPYYPTPLLTTTTPVHACLSSDAGESASFLAKSTYIRDLATVVIGYGMAINIVEVTWKSKLKAAFPDPNSYSMFMGNFSTMTGIATLLMMLAGTIHLQLVVLRQHGAAVIIGTAKSRPF